ncbi:MAG: hypothetical protein LH606_11485 [Cytophagaceae bacterium]|nr:hypothetical protein [Cytophagaceae bacterium]
METKANVFYERFLQAQTSAERDAIATEFQLFYEDLTEAERIQAQPVLDEILDDAERILTEVAPLIERAERMLGVRNESVFRSV